VVGPFVQSALAPRFMLEVLHRVRDKGTSGRLFETATSFFSSLAANIFAYRSPLRWLQQQLLHVNIIWSFSFANKNVAADKGCAAEYGPWNFKIDMTLA
jgi:hypothetical protein